jgi:para-nitrobenzyl esterase
MMLTKRRAVPALSIILALASGAAFSQQKAPDPAPANSPPALDGPIIQVSQGKVQGFIANDVAVFRGLPFAAPPVGDLRWRAPKPAAKWSDVRPGNVFSATCAQAEDCLYLNVYQPADTKKGAKLPVMVWIHGGAFIFGS